MRLCDRIASHSHRISEDFDFLVRGESGGRAKELVCELLTASHAGFSNFAMEWDDSRGWSDYFGWWGLRSSLAVVGGWLVGLWYLCNGIPCFGGYYAREEGREGKGRCGKNGFWC